MKKYYRVMLGPKSAHALECFSGGFVGTDFSIHTDLSGRLPDDFRAFNKEFVPVLLADEPGRSKISAGLACGALWTVSKGIRKGDMVLSPDGQGAYRVGEVASDYYYAAGQVLPHRRRVTWLNLSIPRVEMSEALRNSAGSIGTVSDISGHQAEIDRFLGAAPAPPVFVGSDSDIEDPLAFAMEKHLEDFLVKNWDQTLLAQDFVIFEENGEKAGQQYVTDVGPIDVLAVSKDRRRLLVVELKRGRASDVVVGQILRYMGYVKEEIAEDNQTVEGVIIALEDDPKLRRALVPVPAISFYRYQVSFKLLKG